MHQPEIYLNAVGDAFNDKGELIKEPLQKVLQQYIDAFAAYIEKQNKYAGLPRAVKPLALASVNRTVACSRPWFPTDDSNLLLTGLALYAMAAAMIGYFGVNAYTGKMG